VTTSAQLPLTLGRAVTTWTVDLPALLLVLAAGLYYLRAVRRVRRSGAGWPVRRTVSFCSGLAIVLIATCGVFGGYGHVLFWIYTLQVCLLLLVAPLLLGAGNPVALAHAAAGERAGELLGRAGRSRLLRVARAPGVGPLLLILVTAVVFFTPTMEWSLRSAAGYQVVHLVLLTAGLVLVLPITDEAVTLSSMAYAAMLGLGMVEFLLDAVPGIVLRLQNQVLSPTYWLHTGRTWGPGPLADQHLAGSWLWFFAEAGDLPFLAALVLAWVRSDAREARSIDAALDSAAATPPPRHDPAGEPAPAEELMRPWWEVDPSVFGEDRARRSGWTGPDGADPAQRQG